MRYAVIALFGIIVRLGLLGVMPYLVSPWVSFPLVLCGVLFVAYKLVWRDHIPSLFVVTS